MSRTAHIGVAAIAILVSMGLFQVMSYRSTAQAQLPTQSQIDVTALTLAAGNLPHQQFDAI